MSDHLELAILNAYKVHQSYNDHSNERLLTNELVRELRYLGVSKIHITIARISLWKSGKLRLSHRVNHSKKLKGLNIMDGSGYHYIKE